MMYREPDAAPHLGASPRRLAGAGARLRVHGLERRRRRRIGRAAVPRLVARRHPLRAHRPGGLLRLPGHAAEDQAHRRAHAQRRVARGRDLRGAHPARPARPRAAAGRRALDALALVLQADRRPRRGAGNADGRHAGRAARRRAALAPRADHGPLLRRGPRPARRPEPVVLRGPDRDRRRAPRRLPGGRRADRVAVGLGARTTSPPPPTRRLRWRWCASSRGSSASRSTRASSSPRPPTTSARSRSPCRATPTCRPSSSASSRPPRRRSRA